MVIVEKVRCPEIKRQLKFNFEQLFNHESDTFAGIAFMLVVPLGLEPRTY